MWLFDPKHTDHAGKIIWGSDSCCGPEGFLVHSTSTYQKVIWYTRMYELVMRRHRGVRVRVMGSGPQSCSGGRGGRDRGAHETCDTGKGVGRNVGDLWDGGGVIWGHEFALSTSSERCTSGGCSLQCRLPPSGTATEQRCSVELVVVIPLFETCCTAYSTATATVVWLSNILVANSVVHWPGHFYASHGLGANHLHRKVLTVCSATAVPGMRGTYCHCYDIDFACLISRCSISIVAYCRQHTAQCSPSRGLDLSYRRPGLTANRTASFDILRNLVSMLACAMPPMSRI